MLHVRKVIAKGCDPCVGHPLRNGMECGMPHVSAGSVAEDKHMARVGRPNHQGGDLSLFRCGKDFHLFCFVSHLEVPTVLLTGKTWRQILVSPDSCLSRFLSLQ